jgi:threonine/homoserine/homoserine lactone efflux protein
MVPLPNLLAFFAAALVLIAIPGPSVLFVVGRSLAHGRRVGLLSVLGNSLGIVPQIVAVALGVGAVVAASAVVFTAIKLVGAAYLVYLGVQAIRRRHAAHTEGRSDSTEGTFHIVRQGFTVGVTNPKALVFLAAVLPQFVAPEHGAPVAQMLTLGAVFLVIGVVCDGAWAITASVARSWFAGSPRRQQQLDTAGGLMLIGLGGTLAVTGNKV